jgi:acid phosphatase
MKKRSRNIILFTLIIFGSIGTLGWERPAVQMASVNAASVKEDTSRMIHPDHIIFVWLENKRFSTIIGSRDAPFINSLIKKGTLFTNSHATTHPSYPNYVDFFAGQNNGITSDACIDNLALTTPNLYSILKDAGKSFAWYSEDLPATGSKACTFKYYVQKHNPTTMFGNVPGSANKRFADFPKDYSQLENVVCISPNMVNDMHSGSIKEADNWVKKKLSKLANWCIDNNSVFVIYFDESETYDDNRIPVIAIGQQVKEACESDAKYDHYSWTKTISAMFFAADSWTANLNAAQLITGCWK